MAYQCQAKIDHGRCVTYCVLEAGHSGEHDDGYNVERKRREPRPAAPVGQGIQTAAAR